MLFWEVTLAPNLTFSPRRRNRLPRFFLFRWRGRPSPLRIFLKTLGMAPRSSFEDGLPYSSDFPLTGLTTGRW
jgi:hypothetical protein